MGGSRPYIVLIGGDGGLSGVPTYLAQVMRALAGQARFTVLSDVNTGGYDFVTALGGRSVEQPGLRTSISVLRAWRALRGIARQIDTDTPDLVWAHARMAVLLLRVLAVWRHLRGQALPPLAITFHGLPFGPGHRPVAGALAVRLERAFLRLMPPHHLLFLSRAAAARYATGLNREGALARHHIHVLENCSDLGPLPAQMPGPHPTLVMTGRSGYQKDHATAARILAHLPPDYRLLLCGGGTDDPVFRHRFVRASGLSQPEVDHRVRFLGAVRDVRAVLQEADVFLLTSRYEGMPIAALEAFEAGLPLATTDIPGMAEIASAHPMATTFCADRPAEAAARIVALTETLRGDRVSHGRRIRAAWGLHFSYAVWQAGLCDLVRTMLADGAGGQDGPQSGCPKDGPQSGHEPTLPQS